jgi:hypothetical protein
MNVLTSLHHNFAVTAKPSSDSVKLTEENDFFARQGNVRTKFLYQRKSLRLWLRRTDQGCPLRQRPVPTCESRIFYDTGGEGFRGTS